MYITSFIPHAILCPPLESRIAVHFVWPRWLLLVSTNHPKKKYENYEQHFKLFNLKKMSIKQNLLENYLPQKIIKIHSTCIGFIFTAFIIIHTVYFVNSVDSHESTLRTSEIFFIHPYSECGITSTWRNKCANFLTVSSWKASQNGRLFHVGITTTCFPRFYSDII